MDWTGFSARCIAVRPRREPAQKRAPLTARTNTVGVGHRPGTPHVQSLGEVRKLCLGRHFDKDSGAPFRSPLECVIAQSSRHTKADRRQVRDSCTDVTLCSFMYTAQLHNTTPFFPAFFHSYFFPSLMSVSSAVHSTAPRVMRGNNNDMPRGLQPVR